jgi:soluble lytic murein transglycosylase-like protein
MSNACGGASWEMRPDGLIDIEGEGPVAFEPGSARFRQMEQTWANWKGLILDGARDNGIPPQWILAIMCQETGPWSDDPHEQASIVSFDGGVGLMQITDKSLGDPHAMLDPATNVAVGSAFLGRLADKLGGEFPEIAASYNAGSVRCGAAGNPWGMVMTGDYVGNVIRWNNTAVLYLNLSRPRLLLGLTLGAAGLYVAAIVAGFAKPPRQLARFV